MPFFFLFFLSFRLLFFLFFLSFFFFFFLLFLFSRGFLRMQGQQKGMNQAKLTRLQQNVRIGGKGTARRKRKTVHKTATGDDKKLQQTLKRMGAQSIPQIEEVNMFREDGMVMHFRNPKGFSFVLFFCFVFFFCKEGGECWFLGVLECF